MHPSVQVVVFALDGQSYALNLAVVERVLRAMEVTRLPNAPTVILGVINVQGQIIPVVNLRRRFRLPEREIELSDQIIIARTKTRTVALIADVVSQVNTIAEQDMVAGDEIAPDLLYVQGVAKLADDLILIHDLDLFLSTDEEKALDEALESRAGDG